MHYQPIENYGVIGDLNTVALVSLEGSIDFLCFPEFDSPSIFGALLDATNGGYFKISPENGDVRKKQLYLPDTNVLLTRFLTKPGVGEITDFMPVDGRFPGNELVRIVSCVRGELKFNVECKPRFDYARAGHTLAQIDAHTIQFVSQGKDGLRLKLRSTQILFVDATDVRASFTLRAGERATFILEVENDAHIVDDVNDYADGSLFETINFWKEWISRSQYKGRWREMVHRSALILKLMISREHGSMVAAPTFGLPEEIGGVRNWDYRYTWIRDAAFTVYTLLKLGYKKEARNFIQWVERQCDDIGEAGNLSLMYTLSGEKELSEQELGHLDGYCGSKPVRIGNAAFRQVQLDIYGELLDAVYLFDKHTEPISYDFWRKISDQVDWLCRHWVDQDEGIWEVRGGKRHFLYSRLMSWVALDRAIKIAESHSYPLNTKWIEERDKVFHSIHNDFWDNELQSFVQYRGAKTVDAATLLMPIIRFIGPTDPKWLSTLKRIEQELVSDSVVYRYRRDNTLDGLSGGEGTFSVCTFWYVECLSRAGQLDKARLFFEKMLGYSNHLGLYSEMLGAQGEHLGNFPQAFTHLGLITAALSLDRQFDDKRNRER